MLIPGTVCEPLYEAKSDRQFVELLATKCGLDPSEFYTRSDAQRRFDAVLTSTIRTEDGTDIQPLVTVTQEKIDELALKESRSKASSTTTSSSRPAATRCPAARTTTGHGSPTKISSRIPRLIRSLREAANSRSTAVARRHTHLMGVSAHEFKPYPVFLQSQDNYEATFSDWGARPRATTRCSASSPLSAPRAHHPREHPVVARSVRKPVLHEQQRRRRAGACRRRPRAGDQPVRQGGAPSFHRRLLHGGCLRHPPRRLGGDGRGDRHRLRLLRQHAQRIVLRRVTGYGIQLRGCAGGEVRRTEVPADLDKPLPYPTVVNE